MFDAADSNPDTSLADENTIIVINKSDLKKSPCSILHVPCSIKTGQGMDEFLNLLGTKITEKFGLSETPQITRARHREALNQTLSSLNNINLGNAIELTAEDLRHSAYNLGRITGRIDVEDVLDVIFSSFCIGK